MVNRPAVNPFLQESWYQSIILIPMNSPHVQKNTNAWRFQVWAAFILSFGLTLGGIIYLPLDTWMKGYLLMGIIFTVGSVFNLSKTIRDDFEADKFVNRLNQAKAEKIINDYE